MDNIIINENGIIEIFNIENYRLQIKNNTIILYPEYKYVTYEELLNTDITKSKILNCSVTNKLNEVISDKKKYRRVLLDIWKTMPTQKIIQNSSFNIKLTNENTKGYIYVDELKYSFQSKDAKSSLQEIIHICNLNNYSIEIKIELENKIVIYFKK